MGFFLLLFFQPPLLTSDLLTYQEVARLKEITLSGDNELANLVGSNPVGLRVVAFQELSWIRKLCKNEVALEMARIYATSRDRPRAHVITIASPLGRKLRRACG